MRFLDATGNVVVTEDNVAGPRGGDVNNPVYQPHNRSGLNAEPMGNGTLELHKKVQGIQKAVPAIRDEKPWHRMAAYMILAGRTTTEVAMSAGVGNSAVYNLRQQQWFQELLATLANRDGDEILGVIKSEALASVEKLVQLRDSAEKEAVQLSAAVTLLEHAKGKAVQQTMHLSPPQTFANDQEEYDSLMRELTSIRQRNSILVDSAAGDATLPGGDATVLAPVVEDVKPDATLAPPVDHAEGMAGSGTPLSLSQ